MSNIINKIYSIKDMRDWLINNQSNGLSEYSITPTRAYALVNNPCAKDEDPAIVVAFDEDTAIGYSAVFADEYVIGNTTGRFFWGTTEWIEPQYRGKGIAGKMMSALKEAVGEKNYIGLDSSIASIKLDQKQGSSIQIYDRTRFNLISQDSLKGSILSKCIAWSNSKALKSISQFEYQNECVRFIDGLTYQFIVTHAQWDVFVRQCEMLNWILQYPFYIGTRRDAKAKIDVCEFGSYKDEYNIDAIKVIVTNEIAGFYIITQTNKERTLRYLYYDEARKNEVLASVTLNLLKSGIEKIRFMSNELQEFMHQHGIKHLNKRSFIDKIALTIPPGMRVDTNLRIQGGDGDMFC